MKIAVLGTGGVGGYFGGRLAASGSDVTFVARGAHLEAIRKNGLRVISPRGDLHLQNVNVVDDIAKVGAADLVIVAVKLWDTEKVAPTLKPLVDQGAAVVSFQNGVHKDEILREHLPAKSIIGGVGYIAAVISEPGVVTHNGQMQGLTFGEYDGTKSARVQALFEACQKGGIDAQVSDAIERVIWEKFVFLVGLSGTTATIRRPIGEIRENAQTRAFLLNVMREVVEIGRAKGVPLAADFAENRLAFCDTLPASMTASMHHDLERGNRLELPWLSGGVAGFGKSLGIATPFNQAISDILAIYAPGKR